MIQSLLIAQYSKLINRSSFVLGSVSVGGATVTTTRGLRPSVPVGSGYVNEQGFGFSLGLFQKGASGAAPVSVRTMILFDDVSVQPYGTTVLVSADGGVTFPATLTWGTDPVYGETSYFVVGSPFGWNALDNGLTKNIVVAIP